MWNALLYLSQEKEAKTATWQSNWFSGSIWLPSNKSLGSVNHKRNPDFALWPLSTLTPLWLGSGSLLLHLSLRNSGKKFGLIWCWCGGPGRQGLGVHGCERGVLVEACFCRAALPGAGGSLLGSGVCVRARQGAGAGTDGWGGKNWRKLFSWGRGRSGQRRMGPVGGGEKARSWETSSGWRMCRGVCVGGGWGGVQIGDKPGDQRGRPLERWRRPRTRPLVG